jgi:cell division protein FtsQ
MYINWKKSILVTFDLALAVYLVLAVTSFNRPDRTSQVCEKVRITIADSDSTGFLSAKEVKNLLTKKHLYPKGKNMQLVDPRAIEETLKENSFIEGVECYKTQEGCVGIIVTQHLPMLRVKAENGEDYYLDVDGNIMNGSHYASDLIVATGNISNWYAQNYITLVSQWISGHELWKNQVEQINILPDKSIELVPRIGDHVVCLGRLPESNDKNRRQRMVNQFMERKLNRLDKFYRYGLNEIGWNKYSYINMEFDNQIICRKSKHKTPVHETASAADASHNAQ